MKSTRPKLPLKWEWIFFGHPLAPLPPPVSYIASKQRWPFLALPEWPGTFWGWFLIKWGYLVVAWRLFPHFQDPLHCRCHQNLGKVFCKIIIGQSSITDLPATYTIAVTLIDPCSPILTLTYFRRFLGKFQWFISARERKSEFLFHWTFITDVEGRQNPIFKFWKRFCSKIIIFGLLLVYGLIYICNDIFGILIFRFGKLCCYWKGAARIQEFKITNKLIRWGIKLGILIWRRCRAKVVITELQWRWLEATVPSPRPQFTTGQETILSILKISKIAPKKRSLLKCNTKAGLRID